LEKQCIFYQRRNDCIAHATAARACGLVSDVEKAGCAPEVPGSVLREPNVPRLFDAACFLIVVEHISPRIDTRRNREKERASAHENASPKPTGERGTNTSQRPAFTKLSRERILATE